LQIRKTRKNTAAVFCCILKCSASTKGIRINPRQLQGAFKYCCSSPRPVGHLLHLYSKTTKQL